MRFIPNQLNAEKAKKLALKLWESLTLNPEILV